MSETTTEKFKLIIDELKKFAVDDDVKFIMKDISFAESTYTALRYPLMKFDIEVFSRSFRSSGRTVKIKLSHIEIYSGELGVLASSQWLFDDKENDVTASEEIERSVVLQWPKIKEYFNNLANLRKIENETIKKFEI